MRELIRKIIREQWDWNNLNDAVPVPDGEVKRYIIHSTDTDPRVVYNEGINPKCAADSREWGKLKYPCVVFAMNGYHTIWAQPSTKGAVVIDTTQLPNHKWWYDPGLYNENNREGKIAIITNERIPAEAIKGILCTTDLGAIFRKNNMTDDEAQQFLDEVMIENVEEWSNDCMAKMDYWREQVNKKRMDKQTEDITENTELIRKILKEDLEYTHVTNASPESDEYEMSEGWEGIPKKEEISPQVEEFLFEYWSKNGTELTPCRYIGINCLEHEEEIDKLKIKFYGGYDKALELAKKEIGIGKKRHISSGGYEMDVTPLGVGVISSKKGNPDENPYDTELGMKVRITNGSVQFLDRDDDYRWDFDELFNIDHGIDVDDLYEITTEIGMTAKEHFLNIIDKYGLFMTGMDHNYKNAWRLYAQ